jgi:glycosyltransferase involved in cell wall biosynthesis
MLTRTEPTTRIETLPPDLAAARSAVVKVVSSAAALVATEPAEASIVIPTHQRRELALMAAEAALAQRVDRPFEVIVVDNASTDGTDVAMHALAERTPGRLRYAQLARDRHRSVARNSGIALATGRVVAFTDSDCVPTAGWLAAGLAALDADPRAGVAQGRTGPPPGQSQPFFSHFIVTDRLDGSYCTSNVFYRREALLAVDGFEAANTTWEDMDLGWRVRRAIPSTGAISSSACGSTASTRSSAWRSSQSRIESWSTGACWRWPARTWRRSHSDTGCGAAGRRPRPPATWPGT